MKLLTAIKLFAATAVTLFILFLFLNNSLEKAELAFYDWRLDHSYVPDARPAPLVIVGITQNFERKVGEPFSRRCYTRLKKREPPWWDLIYSSRR